MHLDPESLIETFGTVGLFLIVFAESGLLVGFFLPGDSLLITAGLLASQGVLNFPLILVGCFVAAVVGDQVGYAFGFRVGPALFRRPNSRFFKRRHLERARQYFEEQGPKTVVLARFVPIVRTFTPVLAGVGQMRYRQFVTYNVVGGLLWAVGVTTVGYALGEAVPDIDKYIVPIVAVILVASVVPIAREALRMRKQGPADEEGNPVEAAEAVVAAPEDESQPTMARPPTPDGSG